MRPITSAPWMRGKVRPSLAQVESAPRWSPKPATPASAVVPSRTPLLYQPTRVLMSVLFMPQAPTSISTSPDPATGSGRSSR